MTELPPQLFDRELLKRRRNRSARNLTQYSFLAKPAFDDMLDRVESIKSTLRQEAVLG